MNLSQRGYKAFITVLVNGFLLGSGGSPVPVYKSALKVGETEASADSPVGVRGDGQEIATAWPVGQRSQ